MGTGILNWIALGLIAGWLAGRVMQGGYGLTGNLILGVVGAIVGGYVGGLILGRDLTVNGFNLETVVVTFLGAVALIAVSRLLPRRKSSRCRGRSRRCLGQTAGARRRATDAGLAAASAKRQQRRLR